LSKQNKIIKKKKKTVSSFFFLSSLKIIRAVPYTTLPIAVWNLGSKFLFHGVNMRMISLNHDLIIANKQCLRRGFVESELSSCLFHYTNLQAFKEMLALTLFAVEIIMLIMWCLIQLSICHVRSSDQQQEIKEQRRARLDKLIRHTWLSQG
jgi:hypothetical protein